MTRDTDSTRRSFLKSGALLAAPLAAAVPAVLVADDGLRARLAQLEDEAAIRALHQAWLRRVNTSVDDVTRADDAAAPDQAVRSIAADRVGEPDAIEIASDGESAIGRFQCVVEIERAIAQDCTLARMAHAQGGGFVRRTERRALKVEYVKADGVWAIAKVDFGSI